MLKETKQPLSLQVYAAEALFKVHTGNKGGNISCYYYVLILLDTPLLSEDERDVAIKTVVCAMNSNDEKTKAIAVRALSIPGVA